MLSIVIVDFIYILSESVLAFFFLEIWKISMQQEKQHTRHLVLVSIMAAFLPHIPIRVWGIVYLLQGIPEPLRE